MSNSIFLDTNDGISDVNPDLNWEGVDEKKLIRLLGNRFPEIEIGKPERSHDCSLRFEIRDGVVFELFRPGVGLIFPRATSLENIFEVAAIFRRLTPDDINLYISDMSGCINIKILPQMTGQDILNEHYRQMEIYEAVNRPVLELEYQVDASIKISFGVTRSLPLVKLDYIEQRILDNWPDSEKLEFRETREGSCLTKISIYGQHKNQFIVYMKVDRWNAFPSFNLDGSIEGCADFVLWLRRLIPAAYRLFLEIGNERKAKQFGQILTHLTREDIICLLAKRKVFADLPDEDLNMFHYKSFITASGFSCLAYFGARAVLTVNRPKSLPKIHYEWVNEQVKNHWPESRIRYLQEPKEFSKPIQETETGQNHEEELLKIVIDELELTVYQNLHPNLAYELYLHGSAQSCLDFILWMRNLLSPGYKVKISINAFTPPSSGREYQEIEITVDTKPETILEFISPDPDMTGRALLPY